MDPIKCIIIDDEPLARKGLKEYIGEVDFLYLEGSFDSPLKAAGMISEGQVQLIFLDIQMPKISGLDFMRTMRVPIPVVFTTAYPEFAVEGYELNALDYMVKPVSFERFLKAALKIKDYYEVRNQNAVEAPGGELKQQFFFIKTDNKLVKIFFDEIMYVEALQNYVAIYTRGQKHITNITLKGLQEKLPANAFIQTHKSYIINIQAVQSIEGNILHIDKYQVPISKYQKEEVMEKMVNSKLLKKG